MRPWVAQPLGTTSFQAALESATPLEFGLEVDELSWGLGDTYIRSFGLGWRRDRFDVGVGYWAESPNTGSEGFRFRLQASLVLPNFW